MVHIVMFPPEILNLQIETAKHPPLVEQLREDASEDFGTKLGTIAAYVGVVLDGDYTGLDILAICVKLTDKLYDKRSGNVIVKLH